MTILIATPNPTSSNVQSIPNLSTFTCHPSYLSTIHHPSSNSSPSPLRLAFGPWRQRQKCSMAAPSSATPSAARVPWPNSSSRTSEDRVACFSASESLTRQRHAERAEPHRTGSSPGIVHASTLSISKLSCMTTDHFICVLSPPSQNQLFTTTLPPLHPPWARKIPPADRAAVRGPRRRRRSVRWRSPQPASRERSDRTQLPTPASIAASIAARCPPAKQWVRGPRKHGKGVEDI